MQKAGIRRGIEEGGGSLLCLMSDAFVNVVLCGKENEEKEEGT
jgi:hypothetical protein